MIEIEIEIEHFIPRQQTAHTRKYREIKTTKIRMLLLAV
jgi:hypothetical protein